MWSKVKFHWALSVAVTTSLTVTTTTVTTLLSISTLPCSLNPSSCDQPIRLLSDDV